MVFKFGVARCCCGGPPPALRATDSLWRVNFSNTTPPYDDIVGQLFGLTNAPTMSVRTNSMQGEFSSAYGFGFNPWYILNPLDPFNAPFGGWARDNAVLTFRGGGTFAGQPIEELPTDPTTVQLKLWLLNESDSALEYQVNVQSFWYPNQEDVNFDLIDPRSPVPAGKNPWNPTAVVASAADGLPTVSLSAPDTDRVEPWWDQTQWYPVNIDVTDSYRAATQWWRDTARPAEQVVQFVISMDELQPRADDITNNLTGRQSIAFNV